MRRHFVTVQARENVHEALQIMRLGRLRHLMVERDGVLVGLLSYRSLQDQTIDEFQHRGSDSRERDLLSLAVESAMIESPSVLAPEDSIHAAATRLCGLGVGCLPVVEDAHLVGLVTETDLLRAAYG